MTSRENLEARATELGMTVPADTDDDALAKLIEAAETDLAKKEPAKPKPRRSAKKAASKGEAKPMPERQAAGSDQAPQAVAVLIVTGPAKGRRRAGHHFGAEQVTIPLDSLSDEQVEAISADPQLSVITVAGRD